MLGLYNSVYKFKGARPPADVTISISGLTDGAAQTGTPLTATASKKLDVQNWQIDTGSGFVDIAGATALSFTPVIGTAGVTDLAQLRLRGVFAGADYFSAPYLVQHVAPVAGMLAAVNEVQGTGAVQVNLATGFTGQNLVFSSDQPWAMVSGSILSLEDEVRTDTVTITATNSGGSAQTELSVQISAPIVSVVNPVPDQIISQGTGDVTVDLRTVFDNADLFDVSGASATLDADGYTLRLDDAVLRAGVTITITGTNPYGSAQQTFTLTVEAPGPGTGETDAAFGIDTAAGAGATRVSAPDGVYAGGTLSVTGNVMSRTASGTLTPGVVTIGDTTVALVSGKSVANTAEFEAWLDETTNEALTLPYSSLVISGDLFTRIAGFSWNNRFKNIPDDFAIRGAYPFGTAPKIDRLRIQTSGTPADRATINRLKIQDLHFYDPVDLAREDGTAPANFEMLEFGGVDLQGLEIANCEFSSDFLPRNEGGYFPDYFQNGIAPNAQVTGLWVHDCSFHNLVYPFRGSSQGALIEDNVIFDTAADFFNPEGGTTNWIVRNNDCRGIIGDGTVLHADVCQIQTAVGNAPVSGIYFYGNTSTPGDFQTRAWPQADAPQPLSLTVRSDVDGTVLSATQGQRFRFTDLTAIRTLALPDAASNDGLAFSVTNYSDSHNVMLVPAGSDTIADGGLVGRGLAKYYSDGSTAWKRMPTGFTRKEVPVTADKLLTSLYDGMLIGASAGVNITLDGAGTRVVIRKHDNAAGDVTITAPSGQTIEGGATTTLTQPGAAKDFTRSGSAWSFAFDGVTMQGFFGNPHAGYSKAGDTTREAIAASSFSDFNVFANVLTLQSGNGLWIEQNVPGAFYGWNTFGRVVPSDFDGDGEITFGDGWTTSGPVARFRSGYHMATINNFTVGTIQADVLAELTDSDTSRVLIRDNVELNLRDGATAATTLNGYFNGTQPTDYQPTSRPETLTTWLKKPGGAMPENTGALGTTTANGIYDFEAKTLNAPPPAYTRVFPQRGAPAVPLDSIFYVETNIPIEATGTELLELYNVTDAVPVSATFHARETLIVCIPDVALTDGKEYRITYNGAGIVNRLENVSINIGNSSCDPVTITAGAPSSLPEIANTDWNFTANANAYLNRVATVDGGGEPVNPNFLNLTGVVLNGNQRFDTNRDPAFSAGSLPVEFIVRARVSGPGIATMRYVSVGNSVGNMTVTVDMSSGFISSSNGLAVENTDFGTIEVDGGYEIWIKGSGTGQSRYYLELNPTGQGGSNGLLWSQVNLIPANAPNAPFVVPEAAWAETTSTTVPSQVQNLQAISGDTTVDLTWDMPVDGGSAISDYVVEFNAGSGWTTVPDGVSTATSATITSLVNRTVYDFRVSAVNAVGVGAASVISTATPTAAAPSGPTAPTLSGNPAISGTTTVGETLVAVPAEATGDPVPARAWQWVNSFTGDIPSATSSTYTLQASDEGHTITLRQIETNSEGTATATSAATAAIAGATGRTYADSLIPDLTNADWNNATALIDGWWINPSVRNSFDTNNSPTFANWPSPEPSGIHTFCVDVRPTSGGGNTTGRVEIRDVATGGFTASVDFDLRISPANKVTIDDPDVVEASETIDLGGGVYRIRLVVNLVGEGRQWVRVNNHNAVRGYDWRQPALFAGNVSTSELLGL